MPGLIRRFFELFRRERLTVEISHDFRQPSKEELAAMLTLSTNPGFITLMKLLEMQRHVLVWKLAQSRHKDIRDVDSIQAGIAWLGWIEEEVHKRTERAKTPLRRTAPDELLEEFNKAKSHLDLVSPTRA